MVKDIAWLIFARAGSTRLPNKCYIEFNDKITLEHIVSNILNEGIEQRDIFLCTSHEKQNNDLIKRAELIDISWIQGSELLPSKRLVDNKERFKEYSNVIRICGDSPLYSAALAKKSIEVAYRNHIKFDVITNCIERNFSSGLSVEIYNRDYLFKTFEIHQELLHSEHMADVALHAQSSGHGCYHIRPNKNIESQYIKKLTLDTTEDAQNLRVIFESGVNESINNFYRQLDVHLYSKGVRYD